jgi:hypothetical protein
MSNDNETPVTSVMDILRGEIAVHHDRLRKLDAFRIETVGDSGAAGRLKVLEVTVEKLDAHIDENRDTLNKLDKRTEGLVIKLGGVILIVTTAATLAANLLVGG